MRSKPISAIGVSLLLLPSAAADGERSVYFAKTKIMAQSPGEDAMYGLLPALDDINGDHLPELLHIPVGGTTAVVLMSEGRWSWGDPEILFSIDQDAAFHDAVLADINSNGLTDIVYWGGIDGSGEAVFGSAVNNGDGTFHVVTPTVASLGVRVGNRVDTIAVGDVTGDGVPDLVATPDSAVVLVGLGDGRFGVPVVIDGSSEGIEIVDLEGDGSAEVILGYTAGLIGVHAFDGASWAQMQTFDVGVSFGLYSVSPIRATDLGSDGSRELICYAHLITESSFPSSGEFRVVPIDQNGGLSLGALIDAPGAWYHELEIADVLGTGEPDIVRTGSRSVFVDFNASDPGDPAEKAPHEFARSVRAVDLDLDGDLDLVYGTLSGPTPVETRVGSEGDRGFPLGSVFSHPTDVDTFRGGVATADFNEDGLMDAVISDLGGLLRVMLRTDGGGFDFLDLPPTNIARMHASDIDADGHQDFAAPDAATNGIGVYFGRGDGTFDETASIEFFKDGILEIAYGDADGDGLLDLAVSSFGLHVYRQTAPREFALTFSAPMSSQTTGVTWGDIDGDGLEDVAIGSRVEPGGITMFRSTGNGAFAGSEWLGPSIRFEHLSLTDLDGDSDLDIVGAGFHNEGIHVFEALGDGEFAAPTVTPISYLWPSRPYLEYVVINDVNADGVPDITVAEEGGGVHILLGHGDRTFRSSGVVGGMIFFLNHFAMADMDGDGFDDFVSPHSWYGVPQDQAGVLITPSIMLPHHVCLADLAEPTGTLDLADLSAFVVAFSAQEVVADPAAPFGVFDLADIVSVVQAFLDGCSER